MTGRYAGCGRAVLPPEPGSAGTAGDTDAGTAYLLARTPSQPGVLPGMARHLVAADDRLDLIAFRYYGDPAGWWQICDANTALDPEELVAPDAAGTILMIPVPQPEV